MHRLEAVMHEEDAWVEALRGPAAPETPPHLPELSQPSPGRGPSWRWPWAVPVLVTALAASALWMVRPAPPPDSMTPRGVSSAAPVTLQLVHDRAGSLERIEAARSVRPGDVAWFQTHSAHPVTVWVEGPQGIEVVARDSAADGLLQGTNGYATYRFDGPGEYTFYASSSGELRCDRGSCDHTRVEVR